MSDIQRGLYVTELMGMGVNGTSDYSRGAAGFWIDKVRSPPVSEMTVAGNLGDMFAVWCRQRPRFTPAPTP
jgi:PmbA protein